MRIDAALTTNQLAPSSKLQSHLVLMAWETHLSPSKSPGNVSMASKTHLSLSKSPGNVSVASKTHLCSSKSPSDNVTMPLETP